MRYYFLIIMRYNIYGHSFMIGVVQLKSKQFCVFINLIV